MIRIFRMNTEVCLFGYLCETKAVFLVINIYSEEFDCKLSSINEKKCCHEEKNKQKRLVRCSSRTIREKRESTASISISARPFLKKRLFTIKVIQNLINHFAVSSFELIPPVSVSESFDVLKFLR